MKTLGEILTNINIVPIKHKQTKKIKLDIKNELIIQHNDLIEARYRLSLQEKRLILWLLTQIKPEDEDFKLHKLEILEFAKMTGIVVDSRYSEVRKIIKCLIQRSIEIYDPQSYSFTQFSWLSFAKYYITKGYIELRFDPALKPYLLQLKSHFTKLTLSDMIQLNSIYAMRFYELLKQYELVGQRETSIKELREYCGITEEYKKYNDFKKDVLERAKKEINEKTDINVDYIEKKESRKIVAIEWTVRKKADQTEEQLKKINILKKELRSQCVIINNLIEYGFGKVTAKQLITIHSEETVKNAIRAVNLQVQRGKAKNPKAMLKVAIQEKWHPEIFKSKQP